MGLERPHPLGIRLLKPECHRGCMGQVWPPQQGSMQQDLDNKNVNRGTQYGCLAPQGWQQHRTHRSRLSSVDRHYRLPHHQLRQRHLEGIHPQILLGCSVGSSIISWLNHKVRVKNIRLTSMRWQEPLPLDSSRKNFPTFGLLALCVQSAISRGYILVEVQIECCGTSGASLMNVTLPWLSRLMCGRKIP